MTENVNKPAVWDRIWHNRGSQLVASLVAVLAILVPDAAHAQNTSLDAVGSRMMQAVCGFIASPIVTVVVAVSLVGLLILATTNEDNGMISKILKVLVAGLCIVGLASVMSLLGFNMVC